MNRPRHGERALDSNRDNKFAGARVNYTNSSESDCNVIARGRRPASRGPSGRVQPRGRAAGGWRQSVLLAGLLLACRCASAGAHLVSEDEDSVIISGPQSQLFRGRKLAKGDEFGQAKQVAAFLGVRYASAPIKRLRFMPPTPFNYGPTKQVAGEPRAHDLRHFGPICMQRLPMEPPVSTNDGDQAARRARRWQLQSSLMDRLLVPQVSSSWRPLVRQLTSGRFVQSEDCLNLNIYTPIEALRRGGQRQESANSSRPVLVLIHGHSFDFGSGSTLDGRHFARAQRSLVITLNYRLHILGFPPKAGPNAARTNLGLLDQVAALHWIQANVHAFGGSPNRITLLGAKGGALFVHLLMVSPLARGLFQRAVLEDGTALSPVIANSMQSRQLVGAPFQRPQQQAAARLIGQLNDCPLSPSDDDQPASWLAVVECLKALPAASLARNLPLELVDSSRPARANSIPIASKWLQPIEQVLDLLIKEELKSRLDREDRNKSDASGDEQQRQDSRRDQMEELKRILVTASSEQSIGVSLDGQQLNRLIALMVDRFLQEPTDATPADSMSSAESDRLRSLLAEILGAIYLPSNRTLPVGPLFAPQLEPGLILADQSNGASGVELAGSMLQPNSPFAQRDLLLGLTHTLVDFTTSEGREKSVHSSAAHYAAPSLSSRRQLELGLTEEQAIGQVNRFVHSFYRYHQQEISNSIVSQYLSRKSNTLQSAPSGAHTSPDHSSQQRHKRLFLAEAVRELYRDSLIDIPMIRTALIHSMRQLETLAELFVSQQLVKLNETQQSENRNYEELEQLINERKLDEEFHKFARDFYRQSDRWPIRLVPIASGASRADLSASELERGKQSHSTFLFQMGADFGWLKSKLEIAVGRNISSQGIKRVLNGLLQELNGVERGELHGCSFEDLFRGDELDEGGSDPSSGESSLERLRLWICGRRLEGKLANFIESGNVNRRSDTQHQSRPPSSQVLEHECASFLAEPRQNPRDDNLDDHHLVQLIQTNAARRTGADFEILVEKSGNTRTTGDDLRCGRLLEQAAFEKLTEDDDQLGAPPEWSVFNVFGQQFASVFSAAGHAHWSQDSFLNSASNQLERERFESKVTFWAKFVSALNCSRTQPISAGSLSLFAQANSTLLNMNLNSNCQQQVGGGATQQTPNSLIQSLVGRIKQELGQQAAAWRRHRGQARGQPAVANLSSSQNHHSLRMANMSNGQQESQQQGGHSARVEEGAAELVTEGGLELLANWLVSANKRPKFFEQGHNLLLAGVALALVSVLVLGVGALVLNRQPRRGKKVGVQDETCKGQETRWGSPSESNSQLDAGRLEEELGSKFDGATGCLDGDQSACADLLYNQQPRDGNHLQATPLDTSLSHLKLLVSSSSFVEGQHAHLVPLDQGNLSNFAHFSAAQPGDADEQQHLPTCNLVLMGQHQRPLLSSSSETTSTTNNTSNQRAPSSVSLVSSLTPTNEGQPRRTQKKRVQISDPERSDEPSSYRGTHQQLVAEPAAALFQLSDMNGHEQLTCPIHRSSSSLMLQPNGARHSNGTNSLTRPYEPHRHRQQQRALVLQDDPPSQQHVCAVHNLHRRPDPSPANFYMGHQQLK